MRFEKIKTEKYGHLSYLFIMQTHSMFIVCVCVCVFKECVNNKKRTDGDRINQVKVHIENQFDALKASHQRLF